MDPVLSSEAVTQIATRIIDLIVNDLPKFPGLYNQKFVSFSSPHAHGRKKARKPKKFSHAIKSLQSDIYSTGKPRFTYPAELFDIDVDDVEEEISLPFVSSPNPPLPKTVSGRTRKSKRTAPISSSNMATSKSKVAPSKSKHPKSHPSPFQHPKSHSSNTHSKSHLKETKNVPPTSHRPTPPMNIATPTHIPSNFKKPKLHQSSSVKTRHTKSFPTNIHKSHWDTVLNNWSHSLTTQPRHTIPLQHGPDWKYSHKMYSLGLNDIYEVQLFNISNKKPGPNVWTTETFNTIMCRETLPIHTVLLLPTDVKPNLFNIERNLTHQTILIINEKHLFHSPILAASFQRLFIQASQPYVFIRHSRRNYSETYRGFKPTTEQAFIAMEPPTSTLRPQTRSQTRISMNNIDPDQHILNQTAATTTNAPSNTNDIPSNTLHIEEIPISNVARAPTNDDTSSLQQQPNRNGNPFNVATTISDSFDDDVNDIPTYAAHEQAIHDLEPYLPPALYVDPITDLFAFLHGDPIPTIHDLTNDEFLQFFEHLFKHICPVPHLARLANYKSYTTCVLHVLTLLRVQSEDDLNNLGTFLLLLRDLPYTLNRLLSSIAHIPNFMTRQQDFRMSFEQIELDTSTYFRHNAKAPPLSTLHPQDTPSNANIVPSSQHSSTIKDDLDTKPPAQPRPTQPTQSNNISLSSTQHSGLFTPIQTAPIAPTSAPGIIPPAIAPVAHLPTLPRHPTSRKVIKDYVHHLLNRMNTASVQPTNISSSVNPTNPPVTSPLTSRRGATQPNMPNNDDPNDPSDSSSSSDSDSSDSDDSIGTLHYRRNKRSKRRRKHKGNNIVALTSILIKHAKELGMRPLDLHDDPIIRRKQFNLWATHLKIVLQSREETNAMLYGYPDIIVRLDDDDADQSVFQFILAKSGQNALTILNAANHHSGYEAFIEFRQQCAQINESLQETARRKLYDVRWRPNDSACTFLRKFCNALSECQQLNMVFTESQKINVFLSIGEQLPINSPYYARIESIRRDYRNLNDAMKFSDITTDLYALDERLGHNHPTSRTYHDETAYVAQRPFRRSPNQPFHNNRNNTPMCHICKRSGHIATDCPNKQTRSYIPHAHRQNYNSSTHQHQHRPRHPQQHTPQHTLTTNNHRPPRRPTNKPLRDISTVTCYNCNRLGHYSTTCPDPPNPNFKNNNPARRALYTNSQQAQPRYNVDTKIDAPTHAPNNKPPHQPRQSARLATITHSTQPSREMLMMAHTVLPQENRQLRFWNYHTQTATSEFPPRDDFQSYIPDSGATSHFTPVESDLLEPVACNIPIMLADGSTVHATKIGNADVHFYTDQGQPCRLHLVRVHYVPGLNHRLFSLQAFTRHTHHSVLIKNTCTKLVFDDNDTYTWPFVPPHECNSEFLDAVTQQTHPPTPNDSSTPPSDLSDASTSSDTTATPRPTRTLPLETIQARLGFRSTRSLLAGTFYNLWQDYQVRPGYDSFATSLRIAVSRTHNLSKVPFDIPHTPFELLFMDVIPTPRLHALTPSTAFPTSLLIVDAHSRYSMFVGLPKTDTTNIVNAIQHYFTRTRTIGRTTKIQYFRLDAGSYFTSAPFAQWCREHNIHVSIAAPHHQEMNSIVERQWQTISQLSRVCMVHARLPVSYFHFATLYAVAIINVMPAKGVTTADGTPTCPYTIAFHKKPKIGNFRVFGCPAVIKHYARSNSRGITVTETPTERPTLEPKPIQRALRGIFIGFPESQAGWMFYLPTPLGNHHFVVSRDAVFDEAFESTLAHAVAPFPGAFTERATRPLLEELSIHESDSPPQSTGNVSDFPFRQPVSGEEGVTAEFQENFATDITQQNFTIESQLFDIDDECDDDQPPLPATTILDDNDDNNETQFFDPDSEHLYFISQQHPLQAMLAEAQHGLSPEDRPIALFLPEPNSVKAVNRQPPELKQLWLKAIEDELKTLIANDTFDLTEQPRHGEQVIPIKLIFKAKQRSDGNLDKLKVRAVQRGDLQWYKPEEDTWSPCASSMGLRLFIAELCRRRRILKLLDFIGAFLQGRAVGRYFVRFSPDLKEHFPAYAAYFGIAMMLKKGMYGGTLSGKWWNLELTDWLLSEGFLQSSLDNTYFIKVYPDGSFIRLIFHVDDMLYYGNTDEIEKIFETSIKGRFQVNILGIAHWFLQMRIHHHADGRVSLDQHRYVLNLLQRFANPTSPCGLPPLRDTPAPPDYVFSVSNRPTTQEEKDAITSKYPDIDFRSCLCTILYLAYSTRADILFIVCKLAKACYAPSLNDFHALFWLLGYLRKFPAYGICFYPTPDKSPVNELLATNNVSTNEIIAFSDASWQDCPDTGRSTCGHIVLYLGGVITAQSHVPLPVAMSSAEAEYMSACAAAMNAAVTRMLLYEMRFLGTTNYKIHEDIVSFPPSILCVDNAAAVLMSTSPKLTKKTRHIARHFHFVRDGVDRKLHTLHWVSNKLQIADVLTKTQVSSKIAPMIPIFMFTLPNFLTDYTTSPSH